MNRSRTDKGPSTGAVRDLSQSQQERLAFIDFRLWFLGDVRRPDLMDRFGIAPAAATRDLALYRSLAPANIDFDDSRKTYVPSAGFAPFFAHQPDRVLSALSRGFGEGIGRSTGGFLECEFPLRLNQPPLDTLAVITSAIHQKRAVRVTYHSFTSGTSRREVLPFALVDSGLRWHARVYDRKSEQFRDLVITRIERPRLLTAADTLPKPHECGDQDEQWTRHLQLELVPHPSQPRPATVARDFGMKDGVLRLVVRAAIAGYVLQQWDVDCSPTHRLDPDRYRLWLRNASALNGVDSAPLAPGVEPARA